MGKPAVKDIPNPKQRHEYRDRAQGQRQRNTQPTLQLHKTAENDTSRQQAALAQTTQRLTVNDNTRKQSCRQCQATTGWS